jgi:hypothetical protein
MSKRSRRDEDTSIILPKKVKKTKRNEIDDIFGL